MRFTENTRGFRNNNPGNIRHGNDWNGETNGNDASFETFVSVEYGIRAIYRLTVTFGNYYNLKTIKEFISRYAPPNENNTKHYINTVWQYMLDNSNDEQGRELMAKKTDTNFHELDLDPLFIGGIILVENGMQPFNFEFIKQCEDL